MKQTLGNSDLIKRINLSNIIEILRLQGVKSRAELANIIGLTPASITKLTKRLIDLDILHEVGTGIISGGRPPILLGLNPHGGYIIGINLAPNKINGVITDISGHVISRSSYTLKSKTKDHILKELYNLISDLISKSPSHIILGIGIAMNGMVNSSDGISIFSPHYKWKNFNLRDTVENKFKIPVVIDNDVRAMALGEYKEGIAKEEDNFLLINIGEGIGTGIIFNKELYRGDNYSAGEIGHTLAERDSKKLCSCGKYGCLEAVIGEKAILSQARSSIQSLDKSSTIKDLCNLANDGNNVAIEILENVAKTLGLSLSFLINILNPKFIVLVGDINYSKKVFYDHLENIIKEHSLETSTKNLKIFPSQLGEYAGSIGASILIYNNLFKGRKILKV